MQIRLTLTATLLLALFTGHARSDGVLEDLEAYGSLRGHVAAFGGEYEVQDNSSRIGVRFARQFGDVITVLAGSELAVNLFDSDFTFNADSSTDTGFITLEKSDESDVFSTRLGYLGVGFGRGGELRIGKLWSVYYDVAGWTDTFNVFGGEASNTYTGETDGGLSGTGRAERALQYRNQVGRAQFGAQVQLLGDDPDLESTVAASVRVRIIDGLTFGGAWNRALLRDGLFPLVVGLDGDPEYWTAGLRYENDRVEVAGIYASQTDGDFRNFDVGSVVVDDAGFELFGRIGLGRSRKVKLLAGLNVSDASGVEPPAVPDAKLEYYILGAEYHLDHRTYAYLEGRIDETIRLDGSRREDVVTLGIRFDTSYRKKPKAPPHDPPENGT